MQKKIFYYIFIFLSLLVLVSCSKTPSFKFEYDTMAENVESIEYIYYDNDKSEFIKIDENTILYFNQDKVRVEGILKNKNMLVFLKELSEIEFGITNRCMEEPVGYGIRIILKNGHFIILSVGNNKKHSMVAEFDENNNFINYIASFKESENSNFKWWIKKYFEI